MKLFMEPRSVAILGATRQSGHGMNLVENLLEYGFAGRIYPINPQAQELLGLKAYPRVSDLPEVPDLAILLVPRNAVLPLVEECVAQGIRALIVSAGGFAEVGEAGKAAQDRIVQAARRGGARVLGPNTFGVANAFHSFCSAFARFELHRVPVGMVCQSGLFFAGLPGLVPGKVIDLVNACDVDFCDALEYYEADPQVRLILLHMEGLIQRQRFLEVASRAARHKPVVALHGGRTGLGAKIALTHSSSLAGREELFRDLFQRCGFIPVESTEEMADVARALLCLPPLKGPRLAILTFTMGGVVLLLDACQRYSLELATLSPQTKAQLGPLLPEWAPAENPVDLGPIFGLSGQSRGREIMTTLLAALLQDENVDAIIFIAPVLLPYLSSFPELVAELRGRYGDKPVVTWIQDRSLPPGLDSMGVNYLSPEGIARGLGGLWRYSSKGQAAGLQGRGNCIPQV